MQNEIYKSKEEFKELVQILANTFIQRWDLYAKQLDDGSYICIKEPLKFDHLNDHLQGKITLGAYVLDQQSKAKYIVFDADNEDHLERLRDMAFSLKEKGVPSHLERSLRGGHLWLFFSKLIPGKKARHFGMRLKEDFDLREIELFPKQDRIKVGPGSLIRLPFGIHRKSKQFYDFVAPNLKPIAESIANQVYILGNPKKVPDAFLEDILSNVSFYTEKTVLNRLEAPKIPLSELIKKRVSVYDFVSQYVELSPNGRGLCPFHDDKRASFSIDIERNYWHCFAGCGGGSIIDFWMIRNECDFRSAVKDLAELLL
ncbi:CHC2 zinc finger domain-containing protein [Chloroflexota bacterium]